MKVFGKIICWIIGFIMLPFLIYYIVLGSRFLGIFPERGMFPEKLEAGRLVAYGPGCAGFWCAGGNVYSLKKRTLTKIEAEGLQYFADVKRSKNGNNGLGWRYCTGRTPDCDIFPKLGRPEFGSSDKLTKSIKRHPYYVGLGHGKQYRVIVSPEAGQIYVGWLD